MKTRTMSDIFNPPQFLISFPTHTQYLLALAAIRQEDMMGLFSILGYFSIFIHEFYNTYILGSISNHKVATLFGIA